MNTRLIKGISRSSGFRAAAALLAALAIPPTILAEIVSQTYTNPGNGHEYLMLSAASWTASEAEAMALGGHLVTIRNASENQWIYDTFSPHLPDVQLSGYDNVGTFLWIGLSDCQRMEASLGRAANR